VTKQYLQGQYISPTEREWRQFEYSIHEEWPPVTHLALHLAEELTIYFESDMVDVVLQEKILAASSTLLAFFDYNAKYQDGWQYLYQEFPTYYEFKSKEKE